MGQIEQQLSNFDFQRWFLMQRCNPNYIPPAWKESSVSAHIASWRGRRKNWSFWKFFEASVFLLSKPSLLVAWILHVQV